MNNILDFIKRHSAYIIVAAIAAFLLATGLFNEVMNTLFFATIAFCFTLFLASLGLYSYTIIPFSRKIIFGKDGEMNSVEATAYMRFAGDVIKAAGIVVGAVVIGAILKDWKW